MTIYEELVQWYNTYIKANGRKAITGQIANTGFRKILDLTWNHINDAIHNVSGQNVGSDGVGLFIDKTNNLLNFHKIKAGSNISFTISETGEIVISSAAQTISSNDKQLIYNDGGTLKGASAQWDKTLERLIIPSLLSNNVGGSAEAGGNLFLTSTYHETKGKINIGGLVYNEATGMLGFGVANPLLDITFEKSVAKEIGFERSTSGAGRTLTITAQAAAEGGTDLAGGNLYLKSGISTGRGYSKVYLSTPYTADGWDSGTADNTHQICASFGFEDLSTVATPHFRMYSKTGAEVFKMWGRSGSSFNIKPLSGTSFILGGADYYSDGINTRYLQINAQNAINSGTNVKGGELRLQAGTTRGNYESAVMIAACPAGASGVANSLITHLKIYGTTGLVWNDDAYDVNARFEGKTDPNLVFIDAGADSVGFGIAAPASKHQIAGGNAGVNTQWTNSATEHSVYDGFHVGIDEYGNAFLNQKESRPLIFKMGGVDKYSLLPSGDLNYSSLIKHFYAASSEIDTVNDLQTENKDGVLLLKRCSVTGSKSGGTWDPALFSAFTAELNHTAPTITTYSLGDHRDGLVKKTISSYYGGVTKTLEQRFDWNEDLSAKRIEIKDELSGMFVQRNYTWTNGIPSVSESIITAWTIS